MKLSNVTLLTILAGIYFLSVSNAFSKTDFDRDLPYEAAVEGKRVDRINVYMYARASSTSRGRNGTLSINFSLTNGWSDGDYKYPVNGYYWLSDTSPHPREESGGMVSAYASGEDTGGNSHTAYAMVTIPEMPPPDPTPATEEVIEIGIFPIDPTDTPSPGETHGYKLITEDPFYWVDWYVKAPGDTSDRGEYIEGDSGDGTSTETSMYYTFPSGSMHTGDYLITAVIYRWSDMSQYEETYTATVSID